MQASERFALRQSSLARGLFVTIEVHVGKQELRISADVWRVALSLFAAMYYIKSCVAVKSGRREGNEMATDVSLQRIQ